VLEFPGILVSVGQPVFDPPRSRFLDLLVDLERAVPVGGPLDRPVLAVGGTVVVVSVGQYVGHRLQQVVGVALDIRRSV
jgi:hypothetical protein